MHFYINHESAREQPRPLRRKGKEQDMQTFMKRYPKVKKSDKNAERVTVAREGGQQGFRAPENTTKFFSYLTVIIYIV